jgi:hypothetical protein
MNAIFLLQSAISIFTAALFMQSGLDKLLDIKGNKQYIDSVFAKTFLSRYSLWLFLGIMILELATGFHAAAGTFFLFFNGDITLSRIAILLGTANILMLFTGQRIAKDYAGAAGIVPYFLVMLVGLWVFNAQF